jgi:anti-sigma factor RsiW
MGECEHIRDQIMLYLDGELRGGERAAVEAHLQACAGCRAACERERSWLDDVRRGGPRYAAPPSLRDQVSRLLRAQPARPQASPALRRRVREILWPQAARRHRRSDAGRAATSPRRRLALAAVLAVVTLVGTVYLTSRGGRPPRTQPSEFALMAVATHLKHLGGQLPFEIASDSPERVSAWFAGKLPFSLKLPNYQESSGQERLYRIEGARLAAFRNDYAAYVGYRMRERPITLVVTSNATALPAGGEEIVSRGLRFHYDAVEGLKVITWADRGLTYALVSDLEERGQQSCLVCHAGTKDRDFIEGLRPRE